MTRLALPLLLAGCSWNGQRLHNTDTIAISTAMPAAAAEAIVVAADAWGDATNGAVALRVVISDSRDVATVEPGELPGGRRGDTEVTESDPPRIWLDLSKLAPEQVQGVAMHELGHAFGLYDHEEHTLMQAVGVDAPVVDARTLARWRALQ